MYIKIIDPENYKAALYIRLSKEDESDGPSQSVQNQRSLLLDFTQLQSISVYDTYVDDGWSGTSFDRPAFQRMIEDIESKKVNMVITKDLSRLGRDYIMTGHYMERYFPEHKVRYISLLDGIDTGVESTANDITPFRAIMNDMYAKDISKKIKSVKRDKQKKGQFIGGKPVYGYKMHPSEKNKIVIDEDAAFIVRWIFSMAVSGMSCRKIAERLNQDRVLAPAAYAGLTISKRSNYSGMWSGERISDIIQNETYIGNMVQGRRVKISYKSSKCLKQNPDDWIVVQGTHQPIVGIDTFQKAQLMLQSRRHTKCRTYDYLLKGLIYCHECGRSMAVVNRRNASGEDVLYLICRTYQRFAKSDTCTCHSIKEISVTSAVIAQVLEVCQAYLSPKILMQTALEILDEFEKHSNISVELSDITVKISRFNAKIDQIYADRLNGLLHETDFLRILCHTNHEREQLEKKKNRMLFNEERKLSITDSAQKLIEDFIGTAANNRELLVSLIERIELSEGRDITIKFRFRKPDTMLKM